MPKKSDGKGGYSFGSSKVVSTGKASPSPSSGGGSTPSPSQGGPGWQEQENVPAPNMSTFAGPAYAPPPQQSNLLMSTPKGGNLQGVETPGERKPLYNADLGFKETTSNDPYRQAMAIAVSPLLTTSAVGAIANNVIKSSAVKESFKVGVSKPIVAKNTASVLTTNTMTEKMTGSFLSKLAAGTKNPAFIASAVLASIGSYPFSGFIKEESLQTLSMAYDAAYWHNDAQGMAKELAMREDVLNTSLWEGIIASVPFVNVVKELKDFYSAARLKMEIDKRIFENMKLESSMSMPGASGSSTPKNEGTSSEGIDKWTIYNQQKQADEKASMDYYNEQRIKTEQTILDLRDAAADAEREEERRFYEEQARFWEKERKKQSEQEAADRLAIAKFWAAYKKRVYQLEQDNTPSALSFGLL